MQVQSSRSCVESQRLSALCGRVCVCVCVCVCACECVCVFFFYFFIPIVTTDHFVFTCRNVMTCHDERHRIAMCEHGVSKYVKYKYKYKLRKWVHQSPGSCVQPQWFLGVLDDPGQVTPGSVATGQGPATGEACHPSYQTELRSGHRRTSDEPDPARRRTEGVLVLPSGTGTTGGAGTLLRRTGQGRCRFSL